MRSLQVMVHDYAGHPFQIQLSRELARRGHAVRHVYSTSTSTPQGATQRSSDDPENFVVEPISLGKMIDKTSFFSRRQMEVQYGKLLTDVIERCRPDIIISANTPTEAQHLAYRKCKKLNIPFVSWVQDLYGLAAKRLLKKRLGPIGSAVGSYLMHLDKKVLRGSRGVVLITDDFRPIMRQWGIEESRCTVIHNWAPLPEIQVRPKDNAWSRAQGVSDQLCVLYSGTLAMKHNPSLLLRMAEHVQPLGAKVLVVSQGIGANWLRENGREQSNLSVLPFQPFGQMADVLGSADVLLAVLEPDAGEFSVPSKVLSYLCAQRPILLSVPSQNLAAKVVAGADAGSVVSPDDVEEFLDQSETLLSSAALRERMGRNARSYAESEFGIDKIADRFESVIECAMN